MSNITKYHNKKIKDAEGRLFDSKKEFLRWQELKVLELNGDITELQRQVPFTLIPKQRRTTPLRSGKTTEMMCKYNADFVYKKNGELIVEDTKGVLTPEYVIKRKLMKYIHNIEIQEV